MNRRKNKRHNEKYHVSESPKDSFSSFCPHRKAVMINFMADLLILTGGLICVIFWLTLIVMLIVEVTDNIKERSKEEE